jgi:hypothetical protein
MRPTRSQCVRDAAKQATTRSREALGAIQEAMLLPSVSANT